VTLFRGVAQYQRSYTGHDDAANLTARHHLARPRATVKAGHGLAVAVAGKEKHGEVGELGHLDEPHVVQQALRLECVRADLAGAPLAAPVV